MSALMYDVRVGWEIPEEEDKVSPILESDGQNARSETIGIYGPERESSPMDERKWSKVHKLGN